MTPKSKILIYSFSVLLIAGGLLGYLKTGSLVSIITSSGFALTLSVLVSFKKVKFIHYTTFTLLILDSFFTYRFLKTWKLMPSGIFSILTFIILIAFVKLNKKDK